MREYTWIKIKKLWQPARTQHSHALLVDQADRIPHPKIWFHTSCYRDIAKTAEAPIFAHVIANDYRTKTSCFSPPISNRTGHHSYKTPPRLAFVPRDRSDWGFDQDWIASIEKCNEGLEIFPDIVGLQGPRYDCERKFETFRILRLWPQHGNHIIASKPHNPQFSESDR